MSQTAAPTWAGHTRQYPEERRHYRSSHIGDSACVSGPMTSAVTPVAESVRVASGIVAAADTVVAADTALDVVVASRETCHLA